MTPIIKSEDPICRRLKEIRETRGLSLAKIERLSGGRWKAVVIGSYERGDRRPSVEQARELLAWYGYRLEILAPGEVVAHADALNRSLDGAS